MKTKRIIGLLLALVLCLSLTVPALAAEVSEELKDAYAAYTDVGGIVRGMELSADTPWFILDLARDGYAFTPEEKDAIYQDMVEYVKENINEKEQLHRAKSSDNSITILTLTALGYDVTDVDGHNLLMGLTDMEYIKKQGINGPIWALIALDSHGYEIPENPDAADQASREKIIDFLLDSQLATGGWALSGLASDTDITGMALQALAPYYEENKDVRHAMDEAVETMAGMQNQDGGFSAFTGNGSEKAPTSESTCQILVGLSALGIDAQKDERFIKNGRSPLDDVLSYYVKGQGFKHIHEGNVDSMATEQCYYTLIAYFRMINGENSLYDMTDVEIP